MELPLQTLLLLGALLIASGVQPAGDPAANQRLIDAVKAGNLVTLQKELPPTGKADANAKTSDGYTVSTALMYAALSGSSDIVNTLVRAGADVNAQSTSVDKDSSGDTALILAARYGLIGSVNALIQASANLEAKDSSGNTALMRAVRSGHGDIVNALIKAGADVNTKNLEGRMPLRYAQRVNNFDITRALQQAGAK